MRLRVGIVSLAIFIKRETADRQEVPMVSYIGRRLLQSVPLLIGVSIIGFALMHLAPGGPLAVYTLNPTITNQDIERIRIVLGLDQPVHIQYFKWASGMFTGNWAKTSLAGNGRATP